MDDFNGHVGRSLDGFQGVHGRFIIGKRYQEGRMLLEFYDAKHLCIANTWFRRTDKKKITYSSGYNKSEIDFCMMGKADCKFLKNVKVITGEFQHNLVVVSYRQAIKKETEWKPEGQKQNVAKLRDKPYIQLFECRVKEIMSHNNNDLWVSFKEGVLMACDEVRGYKKNRKCKANMWWWKSEA